MLEDGLAIAELVKREERNAKRRAKRGSDPKATAVDNIVRTFTVLLFSAAFRAQVFPAIRSASASIVDRVDEWQQIFIRRKSVSIIFGHRNPNLGTPCAPKSESSA